MTGTRQKRRKCRKVDIFLMGCQEITDCYDKMAGSCCMCSRCAQLIFGKPSSSGKQGDQDRRSSDFQSTSYECLERNLVIIRNVQDTQLYVHVGTAPIIDRKCFLVYEATLFGTMWLILLVLNMSCTYCTDTLYLFYILINPVSLVIYKNCVEKGAMKTKKEEIVCGRHGYSRRYKNGQNTKITGSKTDLHSSAHDIANSGNVCFDTAVRPEISSKIVEEDDCFVFDHQIKDETLFKSIDNNFTNRLMCSKMERSICEEKVQDKKFKDLCNDLAPSEMFGDYVFMSLAGKGSYGKVYKAYDTRSHSWTAIKEVPLLQQNMAHLSHEMEVMGLKHPNLLSYNLVGVSERSEQISRMKIGARSGNCLEKDCKCSLHRKRSMSLTSVVFEYGDYRNSEDQFETMENCDLYRTVLSPSALAFSNISCSLQAYEYNFDNLHSGSVLNNFHDLYEKEEPPKVNAVHSEVKKTKSPNSKKSKKTINNKTSDSVNDKKEYVYLETEYCDFSLRDFIDFRNDYYFKPKSTKKQRHYKYVGVSQNVVYIPLKYYRKSITPDNNINRSFCLTILKYILLGLLHLHSFGYSHNDLKCSNVMIYGDEFTPKIGDFGMTKKCKCSKTETVKPQKQYEDYLYNLPTTICSNLCTNICNTVNSFLSSSTLVNPEYTSPNYDKLTCSHASESKTRDIHDAILIYYELLNVFRTQSEARFLVRELRAKKKVPYEFRKIMPAESDFIEHVLGSDVLQASEVTEIIDQMISV